MVTYSTQKSFRYYSPTVPLISWTSVCSHCCSSAQRQRKMNGSIHRYTLIDFNTKIPDLWAALYMTFRVHRRTHSVSYSCTETFTRWFHCTAWSWNSHASGSTSRNMPKLLSLATANFLLPLKWKSALGKVCAVRLSVVVTDMHI